MPETIEARTNPTGRGPWLHLIGLSALAGVLEFGATWLAHSADGLSSGAAAVEGLRSAPAFLYAVLPAIAAISCAFLPCRAEAVGAAVRITAVSVLAMVVIDFAAPSVDSVLGSRVGVIGGDVAIQSDRMTDFGRVGAMRTLSGAVTDGLAGVGERLEAYPARHPRIVASAALQKGALLFAPALLVGLVLGIQAWLADRVTFRRGADERVAQIVIAWLVAPGGEALLFTWSDDSRAQALFGSAPLWSILVPYVPFLIVAAVGWKTANRRGQRSAVAPEDYPQA